MRNRLSILSLVFFISCTGVQKTETGSTNENITPEKQSLRFIRNGNVSDEYKNGDIIFIHSKSDLSSPISLATSSDYTHCAVYWNVKGIGPAFFEACSEVEITGFNKFIKNKRGDLLLVMRLRESEKILDNLHQASMSNKMFEWKGRDYDGRFLWDNDELYCSELVYKLYEAAEIKLCELKKLGDFDLSSPEVQKELKERYGNEIPLKEPVIAPVDLIYSPLLDTIYYSK